MLMVYYYSIDTFNDDGSSFVHNGQSAGACIPGDDVVYDVEVSHKQRETRWRLINAKHIQ